MFLEQLAKRTPRERIGLSVAILVMAALACYTAGVDPSLGSLDGARQDLATTGKVLSLQQRQLSLLRAETSAYQRTLAQLQDLPCPWMPSDKADSILQQFQKEAAELGLSVRSLVREQITTLPLDGGRERVFILVIRLELFGPYPAVIELFRSLSKGPLAIGLEELSVKATDAVPYDVDVTLRVRLPLVEGTNDA